MKDFNQIASFVQVIQSGSFSKAALKMGTPKSTLSHRVSELERRLGVTLLKRTTRHLQLTKAGENYYAKSLALLQQLDQLEEETQTEQSEPKGLIRFTAPLEMGPSLLGSIFEEFSKRYPLIQLELDMTDRKVDLVREGYDVALRAGVLADSSLISKPVGQGEFVMYASPAFLKMHGTPQTPEELAKKICIQIAPDGREIVWKLQSGSSKRQLRPQGHFRINSLSLGLNLVLHGAGIAPLPRYLAGEFEKSGKLIRILPEWTLGKYPISLLFPQQEHRPRRLEAFIEFMTPKMRNIQW